MDPEVLPSGSGAAALGSSLPAEAAAVDLGSNSFHMVIARPQGGQFAVLDRLREPVRLAAGLDAHQRLGDEAQANALACLKRFGQRLADMPQAHVRAVGTDTLRRARNARTFLVKAARALGHPIEILPGREEARLIYLGVAHALPEDAGRRLVIDIGGGSTECILGDRYEPVAADSLAMGCVNFSLRHFAGGETSRENFRRAEIAARSELQTIERRYRSLGWERCIGSSGTMTAIAEIVRANGWSTNGISLEALRKLRKQIIACERVQKLELPGLAPERAAVLPGGVAILRALFESFELEQIGISQASMREGVLHDLLGRIRHQDVRDHTIVRMSERYHVDLEHAARVERTALALLKACARKWELEDESARQLLLWSSRLHEVGLAVAYAGHHKHGAYLLANSDLPGFSREEQELLATLVRGHRRKMSAALFHALPSAQAESALRLCVLLRLAVLLNRSRSPRALPALRVAVNGNALELGFPKDWLDAHPLTGADLDEEAAALRAVGLRLLVR